MITKEWWKSKTLWTAGVALGVAVATTLGALDLETGAKIEALLVPLIFAFLRLGDKPID